MIRSAMVIRVAGDKPLAHALSTALDAPNLRRAEKAETRLGLHLDVEDSRNRQRLAVRTAIYDSQPDPWYIIVWCAMWVAWWVFREMIGGTNDTNRIHPKAVTSVCGQSCAR